jgi:hypothetical protein
VEDIGEIATGLLPPADLEDMCRTGGEGEMRRGRRGRESTATTKGSEQALSNGIFCLNSVSAVKSAKTIN